MAFKLSTGLRNSMLDGLSFREALADGFIKIYGGTPPLTADAVASSQLLCIISDNNSGQGVDLDPAAAGAISKAAGQAWNGVNLTGGTATHFRYVGNADTGVASTTEKRLQGTCGTSGADMNMTSVNLTLGATQTVDAANFTLPTF
jgi:hypothetical protein